MTALLILLAILLAASMAAAGWLLFDRARLVREASEERVRAARLEEALKGERRSREEHDLALSKQLAESQEAFRQAIQNSAGDAMKESSRHLFERAKEFFEAQHTLARTAIESKVQPISETLRKTESRLEQIEKERLGHYASLAQHLETVAQVSERLRAETGNLSAALSRPQVRGRYGEIQLRRVVELAGMREYCDFSTQETARTDEGDALRPDMIVRLPNERIIVIDAKTNIDAYRQAIEARTSEEAEPHLDRFARHVADQAVALSKKGYWEQFRGAAEFVVMFIPGDQFIDAALQRRPDLLEMAAQHRVILASPSTLIGLLRAVHVGWREKSISESADELFRLGKELHERVATILDHAATLGGSIEAAARSYNKFIGSVEARLIPTLRRFEERGAKSEKELRDRQTVETAVRRPTLPEGRGPPPATDGALPGVDGGM